MTSSTALYAQAPTTPVTTVALAQQPAAQAPPAAPAAPPRPSWHGNFSFGVGLAGGVQAQRGYQVNAGVQRPFSDGGNFNANVSRQYQHVTFPSESLLADRLSIGVGGEQNLTKYSVIMARSMYLRDQLLYVDSRYEELFGYGLHLYDATKRFDLQLVPGVSFYKENLAYSDARDWKGGGGFYEKFTAKVNAAWSFENSLRFRRNFGDSDRSVESVADLNGMFTRTLGMQLEYQYNYESIVPPDFPNYLQVLSAGLRFQF
jgi:hypothetical protein